MGADTSSDRPKKILQGYVSHDTFGGLAIPATSQNLQMRTYVAGLDAQFKLSVDEMLLPNCHIQFYGMIRGLGDIDGIVMCSLFMLPNDPADRRWVYDRVLAAGASLHCIYESLVIDGEDDIERAEEILRMRKALAQCPATIDAALLPKLDLIDTFS